MKHKILIAEDDVSILTGLVDLLTSEGYDVCTATNGSDALQKYHDEHPDLVLLDIMMPEVSGYDVCKKIREEDQLITIIILTAKNEEIDKVVGLEIGADDYIVKPFGIKELVARIRAAFRRSDINKLHNVNDDPIQFADVTIDPKAMKGKKGKTEFTVTDRELRLLQILVDHNGEVIDRFTLLEEVWGVKYGGTTRTLDQHIANIRKKIEDNPSKPQHLVTVHRIGYKFIS